jgi:hypothetical protein
LTWVSFLPIGVAKTLLGKILAGQQNLKVDLKSDAEVKELINVLNKGFVS